MKTPARLGLYALGLVAAFGGAFAVAAAVVPPSAVAERLAATEAAGHGGGHEAAQEGDDSSSALLPGLSLSADGYLLSPVSAPHELGESGTLSFSILAPDGTPVTEFTEEHEKDLHLIVVRSDGAEFRHVHPKLDSEGTWSIPWNWDEAGTYRVFTDFIPSATGDKLTLTRSISVGGDFTPVDGHDDVRTTQVGGFDVELQGDLFVGGSSTLTLKVSRDGADVTEMQPYLGAFGHLVALREGDLAYLHVHPEGDEPEAGDASGPTVDFATEAPTAGRYLLYFDFQVGDQVYSAPFALTTSSDEAPDAGHDDGASH